MVKTLSELAGELCIKPNRQNAFQSLIHHMLATTAATTSPDTTEFPDATTLSLTTVTPGTTTPLDAIVNETITTLLQDMGYAYALWPSQNNDSIHLTVHDDTASIKAWRKLVRDNQKERANIERKIKRFHDLHPSKQDADELARLRHVQSQIPGKVPPLDKGLKVHEDGEMSHRARWEFRTKEGREPDGRDKALGSLIARTMTQYCERLIEEAGGVEELSQLGDGNWGQMGEGRGHQLLANIVGDKAMEKYHGSIRAAVQAGHPVVGSGGLGEIVKVER